MDFSVCRCVVIDLHVCGSVLINLNAFGRVVIACGEMHVGVVSGFNVCGRAHAHII